MRLCPSRNTIFSMDHIGRVNVQISGCPGILSVRVSFPSRRRSSPGQNGGHPRADVPGKELAHQCFALIMDRRHISLRIM